MRRIGLLLALVVLLAGCGGGGGGEAVPASSSTAAPTTAPAPAGSAGCGRAPDVEAIGPDRPGDVEASFDGRTYRLAVPGRYDPDVAVPLVLNLHGAGSNALQASVYGDVPRRGTARGMVVAAPDAGDGRWDVAPEGPDDAFLVALTEDLMARYCIDPAHVHVVGMSLGAWRAAATTCAHPELYASAALVTVEVFPGTCEPTAVVAFHGTADTVAPYGEGGTAPVEGGPNEGITGARANAAAWAENGGCDPEPVVERIEPDVEVRRYQGCAPGVDVVLHSIEGGGHTWPGSDVVIGPPGLTTDTVDATEVLLDFFEAHPRQP